ncbi:MAG: hypothetical protein QMD36_05325 [Candidatus Aenigmarchaeota archaeon]|nr:hypothetical protein [Candidatus Aenigmarchaeota archaeon]
MAYTSYSEDVKGLRDMLTRLNKDRLKNIERLRKDKNLKKVRIKKDLPLGIRLGLMKMGFDVEYKEN